MHTVPDFVLGLRNLLLLDGDFHYGEEDSQATGAEQSYAGLSEVALHGEVKIRHFPWSRDLNTVQICS